MFSPLCPGKEEKPLPPCYHHHVGRTDGGKEEEERQSSGTESEKEERKRDITTTSSLLTYFPTRRPDNSHSNSIMSSTHVLFLIVVAAVTHIPPSADAHVFRVGDCPKVDVMTDFSMKKFVGTWFVVQKFRTSSNCVMENITTSHDEYFITEKLEPLGVKL